MSNYWDLFAETGEIGYYLLYRELSEEYVPPDVYPTAEGNTEMQHLM